MTEQQKRLAEGIAALVRSCLSPLPEFAPGVYFSLATELAADTPFGVTTCEVNSHSLDLKPLCPLQTLALAILVNPTHASGSALIDALIESGVITQEWEDVIRADEREKCAKFAARHSGTGWRIAHDIREGLHQRQRLFVGAPLPHIVDQVSDVCGEPPQHQ